MMKRISLCLVVAALLAGPTVWGAEHETMGLEDLAERWAAAYNSGDPAAVAAFYGEDSMRMPPDRPTAKGPEAIQAQVQGDMDGGLAKVSIQTVESMVMGETAALRGTWAGMDAEGNQIAEGKWANVCKMVDGEWIVYYDIWNMDAPTAAPE